jgi:MSHA pilin protein MshC
MIELVVTMILIGIMAVVVLPRFDTLGAFDSRGYADQITAYLRYAQKSALAQRRTVRIDITNATTAPTMCVTAAYSDTCPASCGGLTALATPFSFQPGSGTTLATNYGFCFDTNGKPSASQSIQVRDSNAVLAVTITVESETGYVH